MAKKSTTVRIAPQIVGNAGLYYVSHQLSLLGWNTMPTSRNAKGVDLICYNSDCSRMIGVQVKALSKRNPVPLGKSLDNIMGDFWVIVTNVGTTPVAYVMFPDEVRELAHKGVKNDKVSYWLQPKAYDRENFRNAWDRLQPGSKMTNMILAHFFGPVESADIEFCQRYQHVLESWVHGLLTVGPGSPQRLQSLANNLTSIPNWEEAIKARPWHGPIIREFFMRVIEHRRRIISEAQRWQEVGYRAES